MVGDREMIMGSESDTVTILKTDYVKLLEAERFLDALNAAGVDNWEGYDIAQDMLEEWDAESN